MSQAKKQYVIVFCRSSWWIDEAKIFGLFTSKAKADKAMAALYSSDWYSEQCLLRGHRVLRVAELEDLPD